MKFSRIAFYFIFFCTSISHAYVSETSEDKPFSLYFDDESAVEIVQDTKIEFLFSIPEKHYLYSDNLRVEIVNPGITVDLEKPQGEMKYDEFRGEEVAVYHNQVVVNAHIKFSSDFDYSQNLIGKIYYQGCSDRICFRTMKVPFDLALNVGALKGSSEEKKSTELNDYFKVRDFESVIQKGLLFALIITFLAGFITSFTPCVLPVIPLTLAFIGVTPCEDKTKRIKNLLIFVLGLVLMYATLGVLSAALGQTLGFIYQSTLFLIFLSLFFLVMALWMFDILRFNISSKLQNKIVKYQPKGKLRYLYSGLTIGFLAAPCVGPIIGPLLVYISTTQDLRLGFLLMLSYSLGMSVLFFMLGFFSRSWVAGFGEKSNFIKRLFGILLLMVSLYYAWVVVSPVFKDKDDGFFHNYEAGVALANKEDKRVLIDFYADWCVPCHEWDKTVWSNTEVQEQVNVHYVPIKIDCTQETDECEQAIEDYKVIGWPTVLFLGKNGKEIRDTRLVGIVLDPDEFIKYLNETNGKDQ